ncbi:restriction endonuclease subunit S [Paenibacillus lentus]|uniref:restriction endonuclease subunit S n=1 Tax=Paenibacillus lentus TaxID=1338368 RepID=UPI0036587FD5
MSREQSFLNVLEAAAKVQWNVSMILEAKAVEAEKVRNWVLNHVHGGSFESHEKMLSEPLDIHEQLVEVIDGLTKLQNGFCSNLKAVLISEEEESGSGDGDGFDGLFSGSFDLEDSEK